MKNPLRSAYAYWKLPVAARSELREDRKGLPGSAPEIETALDAAIGWLCRAQDKSASQDGGVARHYSLVTGWSTSYPETTGYIVPTLLAHAAIRKDDDLRERARKMLDWLVAIQLAGGGFQGGLIDSQPVVPVTFNTGQILLGLAGGASEFGPTYVEPMQQAADWLVSTQDPDGCWRSQPSPFAAPGEKTYETHVAWSLFEAARILPGRGYARSAMANVQWALRHQRDNGWFDKCCLVDPRRPLTHTIGYVLRGLLEAYRYSGEKTLLTACLKTASGLLGAIRTPDGYLPGRLDADWKGAVSWACLTGMVQIAYCWLVLYQLTGNPSYGDAACAANRYVRKTVRIEGPADSRGAVKGSFPVDGAYGRFEYLNWACKFFIDSHQLELEIRRQNNLP